MSKEVNIMNHNHNRSCCNCCCRGPKGPQGPQGPMDPPVETGPTGPGVRPTYFNAVMQGGFQHIPPEGMLIF